MRNGRRQPGVDGMETAWKGQDEEKGGGVGGIGVKWRGAGGAYLGDR